MTASRISNKDLQYVVDGINSITMTNVELDYAYGGVTLLYSTGNGNVFNCGFITKRDLYNRMRALCVGLNLAKVTD